MSLKFEWALLERSRSFLEPGFTSEKYVSVKYFFEKYFPVKHFPEELSY